MHRRTRFFEIVCVGVPSTVCDSAAALISRVEAVAEAIPGVVDELEMRARRGFRMIVYIVSQEVPPEQLERVARGLGEIVERMKQSGFAGVSFATGSSVVLYTDEMETAETAAEEALHAIFSTMAGRAYILSRFKPRNSMEEWLAEEALVHHLLYNLGVVTREDLEEMKELYTELYRMETGGAPLRHIEELAERLARELAEKARRRAARTASA